MPRAAADTTRATHCVGTPRHKRRGFPCESHPDGGFLPDDQRRATFAHCAARPPVGRIGRPEDVARVILLLAGDTFLTGIVVPCDGGLHLG